MQESCRTVLIHDITTADNNNRSGGVYLNNIDSLEIRTSVMHDNYKPDDLIDWTTANILTLQQSGVCKMNYNTLFYSTDLGLTYGHAGIRIAPKAAEPSDCEIRNNIIFSAPVGIEFGTGNTHVHHNLIYGVTHIGIGMISGGACRELIENNTIAGQAAGLNLHYTDCDSGSQGIEFRNNIILDNRQSINYESGIININTYWDDERYNSLVTGGKLKFNHNCYYNPNMDMNADAAFNLFSGGAGSTTGGFYNFVQWKNLGYGYDPDSVITDPQFNTYFQPGEAQCSGYGWLAAGQADVVWDYDNDQKWSLADIIHGLQLLTGKK